MKDKLQTVLAEVLKRVTPKPAERRKVEALAGQLVRKVAAAAKKQGLEAKVRVEGSVAKDTWLSDDPEVDVFMQVPGSIPRASLGEVGLKVARAATKDWKQVERFAEHPYLEAFADGVTVNVVPCYVAKPMAWLSAMDRTPYHTDYINGHFDANMKSEVRLLKKLMKGVGVYGAEIKIGGFSGYLCELLILHFGSFLETIKAFAQYKQRLVVDIEGVYRERRREVDLLFDEPLVVVDPVDRARNVASAVRKDRLHGFVAASRAFLKKPSLLFFYPYKASALSAGKVKQLLKTRGSKVVFVTFNGVGAVSDILWGQLYKSQRSLRKLLELNDFHVLRGAPWSDEAGLNMFLFELESCHVPLVKAHLGPPLDKEKECERFVEKYAVNDCVVAGPYVGDGRWIVLLKRKITGICELLKDRLEDGGRSAGVSEGISVLLKKKGFDVFVNEEIVPVYGKNREFAVFLTEFLSGKPKWLEAV